MLPATAITSATLDDNPSTSTHSDQDTEDKCPTCGRPYHPVEAVRSLGPEMESAFPLPADGEQAPAKKRRRLIRTARCMTSDDMVKEVREKEQATGRKSSKPVTTEGGKYSKKSDNAGLYFEEIMSKFPAYHCFLYVLNADNLLIIGVTDTYMLDVNIHMPTLKVQTLQEFQSDFNRRKEILMKTTTFMSMTV